MGVVAQCQAGDSEGWRRLFSDRASQIYRWAVWLGLRPTEAEDAAQDVLAIAVQRIQKCEGDHALTGWLYQITRRVVANARRRVWRRLVLTESPTEAAFEHECPQAAHRELVIRRCLRRLPKRQLEVLILSDAEGYTRDEVCAMLSLPAGTVASRLRLGRAAFRRHWESGATSLDDSEKLPCKIA